VLEGLLEEWPARLHPRATVAELIAAIERDATEYWDGSLLDAPYLFQDIRFLPHLDVEELTAINFWVGGTNRTGLHYDEVDNLHALVRGAKRFHLIAPGEHARLYPVEPDERDRRGLNWSGIDFFAVDEARFPATREVGVLVAEITAGQVLYIPAGWWHAVEHAGDPTMAVNFWWPGGPPAESASDSFLGDRRLLSALLHGERLVIKH
jgi:hypothetical protein